MATKKMVEEVVDLKVEVQDWNLVTLETSESDYEKKLAKENLSSKRDLQSSYRKAPKFIEVD